MDTTNTPDLRYPEGSGTVWTATEPGFYVLMDDWACPSQPKSKIVCCLSEPDDKRSRFHWNNIRGTVEHNAIRHSCYLGSSFAKCAVLGPYDTPEEARAAFKAFALSLCLSLEFPGAVFEEPDGTTIPLNEWRQQP